MKTNCDDSGETDGGDETFRGSRRTVGFHIYGLPAADEFKPPRLDAGITADRPGSPVPAVRLTWFGRIMPGSHLRLVASPAGGCF